MRIEFDIEFVREHFMTAPQAAKYLGISRNRVGRLCLQGRFKGAGKMDDTWLIPTDAVKNHEKLLPGGCKR